MRDYEVVAIFQPDLDEASLNIKYRKDQVMDHRRRWHH